jgi:hypothetical protein
MEGILERGFSNNDAVLGRHGGRPYFLKVNWPKNGWILFEGKAQSGAKAERTRQYVSILRRIATPPSDGRQLFLGQF